MLKILTSSRNQKLINAIIEADLDKLARLLTKFDAAALDAPLRDKQSAAEVAISAQQPKSLELIMNQGCNANALASCGRPLLLLALQQSENSLNLITQLLRAGADANTDNLLSACFYHCSETEQMVHLSRLIEYGSQLTQDPDLMPLALGTERLELIHFLINSGAELPADMESIHCSDATLSYAKRCVDDRRVREMMQQF